MSRKKRKAGKRPVEADEPHEATPTPEQIGKGMYDAPTGLGRRHKPFINTAPDLIGVLFRQNRISAAEEQAARHFQQVRAGYIAEIGISGYRSCLDQSRGGYDGTDGDPAAVAAYDALRKLLGPRHCAFVAQEVDKLAHQRTDNLLRLRAALRKIAGQ